MIIVAAGLACRKPGPSSEPAHEPPKPAPARADKHTGPWADPAPSSMSPAGCAQLAFAESTPVPEASGAAWLTLDGKPVLLVVGDSGNHGAYGLIDPDTGATLETGALPLSTEAGDDLEGLAVRGDQIYGLTSSGWMRVWQRKATGEGFDLREPPYPLGPVDLPDRKNNNRAPEGDGMVCNAHVANCGRNYEGLCLAPAPKTARCIGFAASKADGHLYCLTDEAGKLVVHHDRAIEITRPGALADCAFADDGTLWVGSNMFDLGHVYRVAQWDDPARAKVELVGSLGVGFPEAIAARGDVVYRLSDMGGSPSLMARYRCAK
jgi:outer membrane protein assembly factor BamB